jgi:Tol biopolymer transport system component
MIAAAAGAIRSLAALTAATTLVVGAGVATAFADPWLSWGVVSGANTEDRLNSRLFTADPADGSRTAIAPFRAAVAADFSDDGGTGAYVLQLQEPGASTYTRRLAVVRRDGTSQAVPVARVSGRPDVSPDGTSVTFGRTNNSVQRYDIATGALTTLCVDCTGLSRRLRPSIANVALSPDGRYVGIQAYSQGDAQSLVVYRAADGTRVLRRTFGEGEPDDTMSWTADSTRLAYVELGSQGAPDFDGVWRVVLLGLDGTRTETAITAPTSTRLSGPMRLGDTWYVVSQPGFSPTAKRATVLRTDSLAVGPTPVGTIETRGKSKRILPFVGWWTLSAGQPVPYAG